MSLRAVVICLISPVFLINAACAQDKLELEDGSAIQYFLALPEIRGEAPLPLAVFPFVGKGLRSLSVISLSIFAK